MTDLRGARFVVAGSGAVGACVALRLVQAGAQVTLCDPAPLGRNASGIAAGMLAPALEAVFDPVSTSHFALLRSARDCWPSLLEAIERQSLLHRSGALLLEDAASDARRLGLLALGAAVEPLSPAQVQGLAPGVAARGEALYCAEDWRIEAEPMLEALRAAFVGAGGRVLQRRVLSARGGLAVLDDGAQVEADRVVFAGGSDGDLAPELAALTPIRGQLLRFGAGTAPMAGPILRTQGIYLAPALGGPVAGATMEAGRTDLAIDGAVASKMRRSAAAILPSLASAPAVAQAGLRWASPDGLPLVGASAVPGLILAAGVRRNGWLLAPMIAEMVCGMAAGEEERSWQASLDPGRFRSR